MADADETSAPPALTRARLLTWVLLALTVIVLWLVWLIGQNFLGPMIWALALAMVFAPVHRWIVGKTGKRPGLAAALSVALVALLIVAPVALVVQSTAKQVVKVAKVAQDQAKDNKWRQTVEKNATLKKAVEWVDGQEMDLGGQLQGAAGGVGKFAGAAVAGGANLLTALLLMLFFLFFFLRDREDFLRYVRGVLPLTDHESDQLFTRLHDTVFATIYGTLVVRGLQGLLGGIMFAILRVPGAVLWGVVMGLVSIIPVAGAFVVWVPAAIYLAATGSVVKAIVLAVWGIAVIGSVDNVLYPMMVGDRLKMHTVPVFVSMLGGLSLFGATGLVAGPVILAVADTLIKFWRQRTAADRSADEVLAA